MERWIRLIAGSFIPASTTWTKVPVFITPFTADARTRNSNPIRS